MSELVSKLLDVLDPQNKLLMSEQVLHMPDVQDPQDKWQMSEQAPHTGTSAKSHCVSHSALLEGMPNADWVFRVGTKEKRAHSHRPYSQFGLQQIKIIKSMQSSCSNQDLTKAWNWDIFQRCLKDVLTGSLQCGWLPMYVSNRHPGI